MADSDEINGEAIEKRCNARVFCFVDDRETQGFDRSYITLLNAMNKQQNSIYINEENVLNYSHGQTWIRAARGNGDEAEMQMLSTEWVIPHKAIAENDLTLIGSSLRSAVASLSAQFARSIYSVVGAAAEKVGNVVNDHETGSTALSFLEMLKKIEFGVDREGNVTLPQMHIGHELGEKLMKDLKSQPPEFTAEVERVKAERSQRALKNEAERKAKFKVSP